MVDCQNLLKIQNVKNIIKITGNDKYRQLKKDKPNVVNTSNVFPRVFKYEHIFGIISLWLSEKNPIKEG